MMTVWLRWNRNRRNERRKVKVRIKVQTDKWNKGNVWPTGR